MLPSKQVTFGYVVSGVGWVFFTMGFLGIWGRQLSPLETEHGYTFFRNVGWFVTCGWLLQLWETSTRLDKVRRRLAPTLRIFLDVYVTAVLWLTGLAIFCVLLLWLVGQYAR